MRFCVSFPSKTFLIGEYAVMKGGPALLVNTRPRFKFHIQHPVKKSVHPFHRESPAGLFIEENKKVFSSVSIRSSQDSLSGFGLSGAEFNCVYLLEVLLKGGSAEDISCFDILDKYLSYHSSPSLHSSSSHCSEVSVGTSPLCPIESTSSLQKHVIPAKAGIQTACHPHESGNPYSPSGADLVSQWLGGFCIFSQPSIAESIDWPFKDLSFALIRTGENLKTWKHLENLKQKDFSYLHEISLTALEAVRSRSESLFLQSVKEYRRALEEEGFTHSLTKKILQDLDSHSEVLAAKGCGAMGAEVIVVFFKKDAKNLDFLKKYNCISNLQSLDQGVLVNYVDK